MPPAFNLSQDQTLQFNLAVSLTNPFGPIDLTQSEFTFYRIFDFVRVLLYVLSRLHHLNDFVYPDTGTHTNRLFLLSFKELLPPLHPQPQPRRGAHYIDGELPVKRFVKKYSH
jgi:hypothetical protein